MNNNKTYYIVGAIAAAVIIIFLSLSHPKKSPNQTSSPQSSTIGTIGNLQKGNAPWPVEFTHLQERLAAIGLPALSEEGSALHIHQHLDIAVNGQSVPVPMDIGIDARGQFISPIHVHDTSGIIHVESPVVQTFTLGQFFDIWGLTFNSNCIGGDCTTSTASLKVYVDGKIYSGDPRQLALAAHQEIFVFYGTADQLPKTIPATFAFPQGY